MQTNKISIFQMKEKEIFSISSLKYIQQLNVLTIYQILISMEMKIHKKVLLWKLSSAHV